MMDTSDEIIDNVKSDDSGEEMDENMEEGKYNSENDIEGEGILFLGGSHVGRVWVPVLQLDAGPPKCNVGLCLLLPKMAQGASDVMNSFTSNP